MENLSEIIHRLCEETGVSDIRVAQILKEGFEYGYWLDARSSTFGKHNYLSDSDYLDSIIFPKIVEEKDLWNCYACKSKLIYPICNECWTSNV